VLAQLLCAAMLTTGPALAQDFFDVPAATLPSSITSEGGGDVNGSRSLTIQGDVGLQSGVRIRAGYAHVDAGDTNYVGGTSWAGLNSDPLAKLSYGATYEALTRDDGIRSDALKTNLRWRWNSWRIAAFPESRSITLTETITTRRNNTRSVETTIRSPGLGVAVAYNGPESWSVALRHFVYRYDTDLQKLSSHPVFAQRVATSVESVVSQSFDASRSGANVDYAPSWGSVGLEVTRSESAFDHAVARSVAMNLSWDVARAWTLFARIGRSHVDGVAAAGFAAAGVTWMWGD